MGNNTVEMRAEAAQTVSATLGKDSLRAGLISGAEDGTINSAVASSGNNGKKK